MTDYQINLLTWKGKVEDISENIRIFYIVRGTASVRDDENGHYPVSQGDIFLINAGRGFQMDMMPGTLAAVLSVNYYDLCSTLDEESVYFFLNSRRDTGGKYTEIVEDMHRILMIYSEQKMAACYEETGCVYLLMDKLLNHFRVKDISPGRGNSDKNKRMLRILRYIHMNYRRNIGLEDIAKKLYLSPSAASRLFFKATGEHFLPYLNKVRLKHVEYDLLHTDHSILQIALDNGFSTPGSLNKIFKKAYQIPPTKFREQNRIEKTEDISFGEPFELRRLFQECLHEHSPENHEELSVDVNQAVPYEPYESRILNVGPIYLLDSAQMQQHVLFVARNLHVTYLRVWNIFERQMMVIENDSEDYNFSFMDTILDFCVDHKLKVFFDLGKRKNIARSSEKASIYSFDDNQVIKSRKSWEHLMEAFLQHLIYRYGYYEVKSWIFEITFFLNDQPYYLAEDYSRYEAWEVTYRVLRKNIPDARIAGPGIPVFSDFKLTRHILGDFLDTWSRPDIFTSTHFPYSDSENGKRASVYEIEMQKTTNMDFLQEQIVNVRNELNQAHFSGEYYITDWGISVANRNYIQDSCFRGAFTVFNVLKNYENTDAMGIFYASDLLNVYTDEKAVVQGSGGIMTRDGICKPVYYGFLFLNSLDSMKIFQNDHCIATKNRDGDIHILCCHPKMLGSAYYLFEENSYRPEEIDRLFINRDSQSVKIVLEYPEKDGCVQIHHHIVNDSFGSVLNKWIQFGCIREMLREDIRYLQRVSVPEIRMKSQQFDDGKLVLDFVMEPNEIRLITIQKINHLNTALSGLCLLYTSDAADE